MGWGWQGGFKPPHLRLPLCLAHWKKQAFLSPHQVALAGIVTHAFLSLYVYFYTRPIVAFQGQWRLTTASQEALSWLDLVRPIRESHWKVAWCAKEKSFEKTSEIAFLTIPGDLVIFLLCNTTLWGGARDAEKSLVAVMWLWGPRGLGQPKYGIHSASNVSNAR